MPEEYLTIGQVARIKKISIKALRYYEKLGILIPARIDPQTGYRYYTGEQMLAVDMIQFLQVLDIPLKKWHTYMDGEGRFHLEQLIEDGKQTAYEKICELHRCMNRLELASRGIRDNDHNDSETGFYTRYLPARSLLCCPIEMPATAMKLHEKLSFLFEVADAHKAAANYPVGLLLDYDHGNRTYSAYVECFEQLKDCPYFRQIPAQDFLCIRKPPRSIGTIHETEASYFLQHPICTVVEADCIPSAVRFQPYPVEHQLPCDT